MKTTSEESAMAKKSEKTGPSDITKGDKVALPRSPRRSEAPAKVGKRGLSPRVKPRAHGRRSPAIGGRADAGDAFAAFVRSKGLDPNQRMSAGQLAELTQEFQTRPISGYRRSKK